MRSATGFLLVVVLNPMAAAKHNHPFDFISF
jgi:hypothetical protein